VANTAYTGLCIDSAAVVDAAVSGSTSLFPIIMCGQAKSDIVRTMVEQEFRKHLRNEDYRDAFDRIVKGLFELPNDTNIQPNEIGASCLA
jgi:hypothetical protein